ncbi:YegP family protein [Streptodolium elevatio]|uniref:YegP family protein n=1 Tax=Streptodolium elevatio TaxID=3157996 RepID=A0ABV3DVM2_9ACTN
MAAKFEVYEDNAGKHRFRLKAANGEIIAVGEGYATKNACLNGIESIKKNAADAAVVETDA